MTSPHKNFVRQNHEALTIALYNMRFLGHQTKWKILKNRRCSYIAEQFLSTAILSEQEIARFNSRHFEFYERKLLRMSYAWKSSTFCAGRMATVLNEGGLIHSKKHGEAIIFGCQGHDLHTSHDQSCGRFVKSSIIQELERMYTNHHHSLDGAVILIYSHFIPCSLVGDECAKLLREFVQRTGLKVVLAYKDVFRGTSLNDALLHMNHDNIAIIQDERFQLDYNLMYNPRCFYPTAPYFSWSIHHQMAYSVFY